VIAAGTSPSRVLFRLQYIIFQIECRMRVPILKPSGQARETRVQLVQDVDLLHPRFNRPDARELGCQQNQAPSNGGTTQVLLQNA
jgi:hypothetical protein